MSNGRECYVERGAWDRGKMESMALQKKTILDDLAGQSGTANRKYSVLGIIV